MLSPDAQRRAARDEQIDAGAARKNRRDGGSRLEHLLEVVEHEQRPIGGQLLVDRVAERACALAADAEGVGRDCNDLLLGEGVGERDEEHPVRVRGRCGRGGGDRQTRLSHPTRPRERDQAHVVILELRGDQRDLRCAPDERRELRGQLHRAGSAGARCRKVILEVGCRELYETLRPVEALQRKRTEIGERPAVGGLLLEHARSTARDEDLTSVRRSADSRGTVDLEPDVTVGGALRLARVDADPRAHLDVFRPRVSPKVALDAHRRAGGISGCGEGAERAVALEVDDRAAVCPDRPRKDLPEGVENRRIAVAEPANERCRPVHVREDERDRAGRQVPGWRPSAVEALGHERGKVVDHELRELARRGERPARRLPVCIHPLQQAPEPELACGRGLLHVDELRQVRASEVLVLDPRQRREGGRPAVALPVDPDEDVALPERMCARADLADDRREPKRPHGRTDSLALFFELARARADEDTQPPVGGIDALLPDAHLGLSLAVERGSGSHCRSAERLSTPCVGAERLGHARFPVRGGYHRRQQEEEMALDDRFRDIGDPAAVALRV